MPQTGQVIDGVPSGGFVTALQVTQKPAAARVGAGIPLVQRGHVNDAGGGLSWSNRFPPASSGGASPWPPLPSPRRGRRHYVPADLPSVLPDRERLVTLGGISLHGASTPIPASASPARTAPCAASRIYGAGQDRG